LQIWQERRNPIGASGSFPVCFAKALHASRSAEVDDGVIGNFAITAFKSNKTRLEYSNIAQETDALRISY
jgi:hypothetical protein